LVAFLFARPILLHGFRSTSDPKTSTEPKSVISRWNPIMEPRVQKAHLQTILKAAHVSRDKIELEFRV